MERCAELRRLHLVQGISIEELAQFDLWEPRLEIPVGFGQSRRAYVLVGAMGVLAHLRAALKPAGRSHASTVRLTPALG